MFFAVDVCFAMSLTRAPESPSDVVALGASQPVSQDLNLRGTKRARTSGLGHCWLDRFEKVDVLSPAGVLEQVDVFW